jgi:C1A family cysteine protease
MSNVRGNFSLTIGLGGKMKRFTVLCFGTMLLVFLSCPAMAAQTAAFGSPNPTMQRYIQNLQREVRENRHNFTVGYSSALEHTIERLCGLREPSGWLEDAPVERLTASLQASALPSSFDWRTQNGTTPIKNQGQCGDCWAFGTVAPLESQIKLQCNLTVDLSEQYLTSCNLQGWGCNGGWWAHDYHMSKLGKDNTAAGAVLEADDPFKAANTACGGPYKHPYQITNWAYIAGQPMPSVQAIKQAIYTYGPISAAVYVGPKFQAYSSGIFDASESGQVNHAIALVGWNDDLGTDNGYWILRNSWGTGWGESGYMRIRYGKSQVGYAANYIQFACNSPAPTPTPTPDPTPPPASVSLPDLQGSFSSLTVYSSGHQVVGSLKIVNQGQANAGAFKTQLYLSTDGKAKTLYLGQAIIGSLAKGSSATLSFNKSSSTTLFSGKYLLAIIDSDSQVKESNESNNNILKLVP